MNVGFNGFLLYDILREAPGKTISTCQTAVGAQWAFIVAATPTSWSRPPQYESLKKRVDLRSTRLE